MWGVVIYSAPEQSITHNNCSLTLIVNPDVRGEKPYDTLADKTTGTEETSGERNIFIIVNNIQEIY